MYTLTHTHTHTHTHTYIPPYDDPDVIAGQGTVAMELMWQFSKPLHAVFVCVGGGGLIAGIDRKSVV